MSAAAALYCVVSVMRADAPAHVASAQAGTVPAILAGSYGYVRDAAHAQGVVRSAIEPRIAALPFFMQGIARDRMRAQLQVPQRLTIEVGLARVSVTYHGDRAVVVASPVPGATTASEPGGNTIPVTQRLSGGWLEQRFEIDGGVITRLLSCEPDGSVLHLDTTITSPRLGEPIRFRLDYRRDAR